MDKIYRFLLSAALLLCCIMLDAQQPTGDGSQANPYQIATPDDLVWFADYVNSGNTSACAILTADITVNTGVLDSNGNLNGTPSNTWTPIGGQNGRDYSGEFNGDGHTISGLYFNDGTKNNVGLFGKAVGNARIHNLGIKDSYFCGKDHVGGICGDFASGRIENCWSEVTVYVATGDGGGLTGSVYINAVLTNCYSICNVSGNGSRGLVCGAFYGTIENCYAQNRNSTGTTSLIGWTSGEGPHTATNVEIKDAAAFASGEVCWLLNNGVTDGTQKWYQTLGGTDNFPVLNSGHGTVYYGYDGDVLTYSNSPLDPSSIDDVAYIDANGVEQTADNVSIIRNASEQVIWSAGWYVVQGNVTLSKGAACNGEVHLILADGAKLTATGSDTSHTPGIQVSGDGNSLAVYGQSAQSGELVANGGNSGAGIGGQQRKSGSNITINGGVVTATGGRFAAGIGGGMLNTPPGTGGSISNKSDGFNITINGGTVTAEGGDDGAGIGGGKNGSGYDITIHGGTVTATGGQFGAGIGGGQNGNGSNIIINDGTVTANGGQSGGAGIGGGYEGYGSNITLNGGTVTANGVGGGAGIGGGTSMSGAGQKGDGFNITINGGKVTANGGGHNASGIGGGMEGSGSNIIIAATLLVKADAFNPPMTVIPNTGADLAGSLNGKQYVTTEPIIITPYIDADGQERTADAVEITSSTLNAGWYVVRGSDENHGPLTCNGDVHIILADGGKLTATGYDPSNTPGIQVSGQGNSLTIYGQTAQTGQLVATGGYYAAGIGGEWKGSGSNITINGGIVTANGGGSGAGIGGGDEGSGSNITINGGIVTANGGSNGAGIGGGYNGSGSNIIINDGTVTANGGENGAGIGGGAYCFGSYITINGGTVTANGGKDGAGIGGGHGGSGYNITINGGIITATGGEWASAIGRGYVWKENYCSDIFVVPELIVRAGNDNPPTTVIAHTATTDIADALAGKRYATVRIPQGGIVTYGEYITVIPQFASGDRVAAETGVTFTAEDRYAYNYEFVGFYKESTFENKITNGVSGLAYTVTVLDDDISVYAKYEKFIPTPYIDANGQEQSVKTTEITNSSSTLIAGWYVVTGSDVQTGTLTCNGAVNLILADGAKLTATGGENQAGITVSGDGNSLTIYSQTAQTGQLIAKGGSQGAGIGGGNKGAGSNIAINGGTVTASGGFYAAGIGGGTEGSGSNIAINGGTVTANGGVSAAGIGGGFEQSGYDITINGGEVTANGGEDGAGIGGGDNGSGWSVKVATALTVYADNTNPPTIEISYTDDDIAPYIVALRYVIVNNNKTNAKEAAIAEIYAAIEGVTNEDIIAIATNAINAINAATSVDVINAIKEQALAAIASAKAIYASGLGEMGEPCEDCPSVEVTKGDKTVKLYNPESVKFKKE